jgi:adenylyltransferase/sulfurtransferase
MCIMGVLVIDGTLSSNSSVFPTAPENVVNCSDGGILGAITGVMGSLQALEAIKILSGIGGSYSQRLCLFDGADGSMKVVKLRGKQAGCAVCSANPRIVGLGGPEYSASCGMHDKSLGRRILADDERITCLDFAGVRGKEDYGLIDVRRTVEWDIARFDDAVHVPLDEFGTVEGWEKVEAVLKGNTRVFVVCRRGNDSQVAVRYIKEQVEGVDVCDLIGGYTAWAREVDDSFPIY